jgi:adenine-specific DNA methylase
MISKNMVEIIKKNIEENLKNTPSTRYQGSKRKILPWLYDNFKKYRFKTVLDGFGGTGSVSYLFKLMGKKVTFNDILSANYQSGIALIENSETKLNQKDVNYLLNKNGFKYPTFIQDTFKNIYYLDRENKWLDVVAFNIEKLSENYSGEELKLKKALSYHILFQACLCKRPFNLFHRKNLYIRTSNIRRSFGNKTTWERGFDSLFLRFNDEISKTIFSNGKHNKAICEDITNIKKRDYDLVYLDPPYARLNGKSPKDYYSLYHFLEGLVNYNSWQKMINWESKNRRLIKIKSRWDENNTEDNLNILFKKFENSIIAVSYGEPGKPPINKIIELLNQYKRKVVVVKRPYKYRLNSNNGKDMQEVLIIGA